MKMIERRKNKKKTSCFFVDSPADSFDFLGPNEVLENADFKCMILLELRIGR